MREFITSTGGATITGSLTLVFLNPPAAPNFNIAALRAWIGQAANATSAQQQIQLHTQVTAFPTLTGALPAKVKRADPNVSILVSSTTGAAATSGVNSSTDNGGAQTVILSDAFNVLNGWLYVPTPDEVIVVPAGSTSGLGLKLPVAPATLTAWGFGVTFGER
jgi:hypothetical protein